jgi:hypothetical protein
VKGNAIAMFVDSSGLQDFDKLELWAVAVVIVYKNPLVISIFPVAG